MKKKNIVYSRITQWKINAAEARVVAERAPKRNALALPTSSPALMKICVRYRVAQAGKIAASRIVRRNARVIATNAIEMAATSRSRNICRKRVSVMYQSVAML